VNNHELIIAIAKQQGWTHIRPIADRNPDSDRMFYIGGSLRDNEYDEREVPEYTRSHGAIQSALATLNNRTQCEMFEYHLFRILSLRNGDEGVTCFDKVRAGPAELSAAFAKTLGLWKESK
jgi:hypothetical protein